MLFGKEVLKKDLEIPNGPAPLPLICRNNKQQGSQGNDVGISPKFCNDFLPMLTDVGICMAKDSVFDVNTLKMKINPTQTKRPIPNGLRFAETTLLISNGDLFGTAHSENPFMVCNHMISFFFQYYQTSHTEKTV